MNANKKRIDKKVIKAIEEISTEEIEFRQKQAGRRLTDKENNKVIKEVVDIFTKRLDSVNKRLVALMLSGTLAIGGVAGGVIGYNAGKNEGPEKSTEEYTLKVDKDSPQIVKEEFIKQQVEEIRQKINSFETKEQVMDFMAELYAKDYEKVTGKELNPEKIEFVLMSDRAVQKDGRTVKADVFSVKKGMSDTIESATGNAHKLENIGGEVDILSENGGESVYASLWGLAQDKSTGNDRKNAEEAIKRYEDKISKELEVEDRIQFTSENDRDEI